MEIRETHHVGHRVFIKGIGGGNSFDRMYNIYEYSMRTASGIKEVYMVEVVWTDGDVTGQFMYDDYQEAICMVDRFMIGG